MKKALITGVNGFIGQYVAKAMMKEGYAVCGLDLATSSPLFIIKYYQRNLLTDSMEDILTGEMPDVVIHCAGLADVNYSVKYPESDFFANVVATRKVLFTLQQADLKCRFIYLSSAAVYGQPYELPIREDAELNPMSPYALHKKMSEDICLYCMKQYNMDVVVLRIFSAYGPGLRKQLFWDMGQKIKNSGKLNLFGTGNESRDYIYIDDLTNVIVKFACTEEKLKHVVYNVANGQEIFIKDIAREFAVKMGYSDDIICFNQVQKEGNPINWRADIRRITEMGYIPFVTMSQGIVQYVEWLNNEYEGA